MASTTASSIPGALAAASPATQAVERPNAISLRAQMDEVRRLSSMLKAISHESRLIILCALLEGPKAVSELESILELRQPAVSQQLARLRGDRLVRTHRQGKMIYYALAEDAQVRDLVAFLCDMLKNGPREEANRRA